MAEQEKIRQVVSNGGTGKREKKGLAKLSEIVFTSDIKEVERWALQDQLLPWVKSTLINAISRFTLNGRSGYSATPTSNKPSGTTYSYNQISQQPQPPAATTGSRVYGPRDTGRIIIKNNGERSGFDIATEVLSVLDEYRSQYGKVRVMDFYEAVGATGAPECQNWGWEDLTKAQVIPLGSGEAWIAMPQVTNFR